MIDASDLMCLIRPIFLLFRAEAKPRRTNSGRPCDPNFRKPGHCQSFIYHTHYSLNTLYLRCILPLGLNLGHSQAKSEGHTWKP